MKQKTKKYHDGFTVLESMIAISVAAILLAVGVPSIRSFRANNQITATTNSILTGLNLARFNAVMLGENVLVCPSANSVSCSHGNWYRGWIVFVESGASNEADNFTPAEANIIRAVNIQQGAEAAKLKQDTGFTDTIVFEADGTTSGTTAMVIDVCYGNTSVTERHKQVAISPFGPISSSSVATVCS
jgi:prepilin-type N-terminal cleavage/methylation domain-containing protein